MFRDTMLYGLIRKLWRTWSDQCAYSAILSAPLVVILLPLLIIFAARFDLITAWWHVGFGD